MRFLPVLSTLVAPESRRSTRPMMMLSASDAATRTDFTLMARQGNQKGPTGRGGPLQNPALFERALGEVRLTSQGCQVVDEADLAIDEVGAAALAAAVQRLTEGVGRHVAA